MSITDVTWADALTIYALGLTSPIFYGIMGVAVAGALIAWRFGGECK